MASGLPDYYRGVDIAYQALSQMIIRPKYGGAIVSTLQGLCNASGWTDILTVIGKGMIYGGMIYFDHTSTQRDSYPALYIDGSGVLGRTFSVYNKNSIVTPGAHPLWLSKYDDVNFIYVLNFSGGITFETSLLFSFREVHGTAPVFTFTMVYALV